MKFKKYGEEIPDIMEKEGEIQPIEFAKRSILKRLDYLLAIIKEKNASKYSDYLNNLEMKYTSLVEKDFISSKDFDIKELLTIFVNLKDQTNLAKNYLNYFLQLLQFSDKDDFTKEKVKVLEKNYLRSYLMPKYYNVLVLTETISPDEAIQLYKYYVSQYIISNSSPNRKIFEKLEDFQEYFEMDKKEITIGWYGYLRDVKDGKFFFRKDNCPWAEILTDLPDKELKYLACCYGDFQAAKGRSNGNHILTMKHTIVEGDPYCDCIIHDTNVNWNLTHPPKEFWDKIGSSEK